MAVRVVVADDNYLVRQGVAGLIDADPELEMVGVAEAFDELLEVVDTVLPDVVITDIRMPPTGTDEGVRAAALIRQRHPTIGVVVLSQYASPSYALALLEDGSDGRAYLLKDRVADADDLVDAVRTVARGGSVIDPKVVEELVNARARMASSPIERLTPREREILGEMAQGKSNAAGAATLIRSERAVEKHINSIFSKLHLTEEPDVNRRVKAVLVHLSAGGG
ncbi:response regulator transcription factor [soil metagenome]